VEHDRQMIETADEVIDLGPSAGEGGGRIVFQGSVTELAHCKDSLTGRYLSGKEKVQPYGRDGRRRFKHWVQIDGAEEHNLKGIDVTFPLGGLSVITGVSGSGKSTLLYDVLYNNHLRLRGRPVQEVGRVRSIQGLESIEEMILVDQSPIGRTPRSNPVTYVGCFDEIRKIFAATPEARRAGVGAGDFSFNVAGGRCVECEGSGKIKVEMQFLADLYVDCERCEGKRFQERILRIRYNGKNIDEVLNLTVGEALPFFASHGSLVDRLSILKKVGLEYLRLGQPATTLSAGEAQRMKLAVEMTEVHQGQLLYLFDEPTIGLHYHDIKLLMEAFWGLLGHGHSILLIEHNMEVIRCADYIIDLGPEGGQEGGEIVFQGFLRDMMEKSPPRSHTFRCLQEYCK
jgi:excinuclease ABC subunit A